ncbi:MAG: hypothetical protein M3O41_05435 [Pseudomonadota bacterium]|nr:hypothetical protein [Pseudomonadota bacterium]
MKVAVRICLAVGILVCGNSMSDDASKPFAPTLLKFFSYHNDQTDCRANPTTDSEIMVNGGGEQWVIIAPRRVVAPESEQKRAGAPLDIEVAEPLESILRTRLADSPRDRQFKEGASNVIRIKIVSVSHDVSYLGMGKAQAHIRLDFYICAKGDVPDTSTVKTVTRNGPDISTLWHQPRGSELQAGFRKATDEGLTAIVDYAFRSSK